jgi:hypothetical protein
MAFHHFAVKHSIKYLLINWLKPYTAQPLFPSNMLNFWLQSSEFYFCSRKNSTAVNFDVNLFHNWIDDESGGMVRKHLFFVRIIKSGFVEIAKSAPPIIGITDSL